ncbi:MAG: hypothetical protein KY429_06995 [Actinobacteria bacterium]|nr:hypothetical protein [Actinomycetota bacterium]
MNHKLLEIYLNDHLAGAVGGLELARRCRSNNEGSSLGQFLDGLVVQIEQDKGALESLIEHLGLPKSNVKQAAGWIVEKIGRIKLNGQLTGYSDLSRLEELEGLFVGVNAKLALWRSLDQIEPSISVPPGFSLEELIKRAESQIEDLNQHHSNAAQSALSRSP